MQELNTTDMQCVAGALIETDPVDRPTQPRRNPFYLYLDTSSAQDDPPAVALVRI